MRILMLDDDAPFVHMLADSIRRQTGFEIQAVATVDKARMAVNNASLPFDLFLFDYNLDTPGTTGVDLMQELHKKMQESDTIIITGEHDGEAGIQAFQAGAHRYITKPFQTQELIHIILALQRERSVRKERDWLHTMASIATDLQRLSTVSAVAEHIGLGAQILGFERMRLWLSSGAGPSDDIWLKGEWQMGHHSAVAEHFTKLHLPLAEFPHYQEAFRSRLPMRYENQEYGSGEVEGRFPSEFKPPVGEWFVLPLWTEDQPVGILLLDNFSVSHRYSQREEKILELLAAQAAAALSRAQQNEEDVLVRQISHDVMVEAPKGDLDTFLDTVRSQVGRWMDVTNFIVAYYDEESHQIDFRRQYECGELQKHHWENDDHGLTGYVIKANQPLLLPEGSDEFRKRHGLLERIGKPARSWLGIPFGNPEKALGTIIVQNYDGKHVYTSRDSRLLQRIVWQIAGALEAAYKLERQEQKERQRSATELLDRYLVRLSQGSEIAFWHAVLTTITHRNGYSVNRAVLLRYDQANGNVTGEIGIGHVSYAASRAAWEKDEKVGHSLAVYFDRPFVALAELTPLHDAVMAYNWKSAANDDAPYQSVLRTGQRHLVTAKDLTTILPNELYQLTDTPREPWIFPCAVLPVRNREHIVGFLLLDNGVDRKPLRTEDLDRIEKLVGEAASRWESSIDTRLGESYKQILRLKNEFETRLFQRPLKESLNLLCQKIQKLTKADCIVLYPYLAEQHRYEVGLVCQLGVRQKSALLPGAKPRQQGVTFSILQSGLLTVENVANSKLMYGGNPLADHKFIEREQIKALIGIALRQVETGEALGVIYINYREPQKFSDVEILRARELAEIGTYLIDHYRKLGWEKAGRSAAEADRARQERNVRILGRIAEQSLAPDADEIKVIRAILQNSQELFEEKSNIRLLLTDQRNATGRQMVPDRFYKLSPSGVPRKVTITKRAFFDHAMYSEGVVIEGNQVGGSIRIADRAIGAIVVTNTGKNAEFGVADQDILLRFCAVAALALGNIVAYDILERASEAISAVVDPNSLDKTLENIIDQVRKAAPTIDCITLWYKDTATGKIVAGPQWGVKQKSHQRTQAQSKMIVRNMMKRKSPLFAPDAQKELVLRGEFLNEEGICSAAAFPLRFGESHEAIGVLFLNYRQEFKFTLTEKKVFLLFANATATAIHAATALNHAQQRERQLSTLVSVAAAGGASLNLDRAITQILTVLQDNFRERKIETNHYLMVYDDQDETLTLHPAAQKVCQPHATYAGRATLNLAERGITTRVARQACEQKRLLVKNIPNLPKDPDSLEEKADNSSELVAGLVSNEKLVGALIAKCGQLDAFEVDDERLFEAVAHQVAILLTLDKQIRLGKRSSTVAGMMAWAADIAHETNREIGRIRNRVSWVQDVLDTSEEPEALEWLQEIDFAARKLAKVSRDTRRTGTDMEEFSVAALLAEEVRAWREKTGGKFTLTIIPTTVPDQVTGNREKLWRAVRHLLNNAVTALENHPGPREITLSVQPADQVGRIALHVCDTGPGIPDAVRRLLFWEPYSTKVDGAGGHGLLIAQSLLESMNCQIGFASAQPEQGACFIITLPVAPSTRE